MLDVHDVVIVGGGKMGEAVLSGWIASDKHPARDLEAAGIVVVEPDQSRREQLESAYGVTCVSSVEGAADADMVVLAVKPQVMGAVLEQLGRSRLAVEGDGAPLFVSIAAGLTTASLEAGLPRGAALVRVMPNMPLMVGGGASAVCAGAQASSEQVAVVKDLFGCLGGAVVVDEADMDAVCALSGSGPAYVAAFIEELRDAAAAHGLSADLAEELALQTVLGTARLINETDLSVSAAREAICSPGGTTLAALQAMAEHGFGQAVAAGVDAAVARSKELAKC